MSFRWVSDVPPLGLPYTYVEEVDLPFNNIQVASGWAGGSGFTYFPSTHDISSFSITFYEDIHATTMKWLLKWKSKVKDFSTGLYGLPDSENGYKQNWTFILTDNKGNPVLRSKMTGMWPAETSNFTLNTESARITISQTFSVDGQELQFS